jgi:hypothetical protein
MPAANAVRCSTKLRIRGVLDRNSCQLSIERINLFVPARKEFRNFVGLTAAARKYSVPRVLGSVESRKEQRIIKQECRKRSDTHVTPNDGPIERGIDVIVRLVHEPFASFLVIL